MIPPFPPEFPDGAGHPLAPSGISVTAHQSEGAGARSHEPPVTGADAFNIADLPDEIARRIRVNLSTGCWEWQGPLSVKGYGHIRWQKKTYRVHRLVYALLVGPIPDGLILDHVKDRGCESKACCWPQHLEPVTNRENILRGDSPAARAARRTECPRGHPYDDENTYRRRDGSRRCKTCDAVMSRRRNGARGPRRDTRKGARYSLNIKLVPEIAHTVTRMAHEDGLTVSPWISALIVAEIERRSGLTLEAQHG